MRSRVIDRDGAPTAASRRVVRRRLRPLPAALAVGAVERRQGGEAPDRLGGHATDLRAGPDRAAGCEVVEQLGEIFRRQIFVIVVVDLDHRGIAASAEAFDLAPREQAVRGDVVRRADALAQHGLDVLGA